MVAWVIGARWRHSLVYSHRDPHRPLSLFCTNENKVTGCIGAGVLRRCGRSESGRSHKPKIKTNGVLFTFFFGPIARVLIGFDSQRLLGVPLKSPASCRGAPSGRQRDDGVREPRVKCLDVVCVCAARQTGCDRAAAALALTAHCCSQSQRSLTSPGIPFPRACTMTQVSLFSLSIDLHTHLTWACILRFCNIHNYTTPSVLF
jgi:hypothetical protein